MSKLFQFLLKIKNKEFIILLIILFFFITLSIFKINGSSIDIYNLLFYPNGENSSIIIGTPRGVRSDEWLVATQYSQSQAENNFTSINEDIGFGQNMTLLYDTPSTHCSSIFKPLNFFYFIFSFEVAFSIKWWLRIYLIILSSYVLLKQIGIPKRYSLISALAISFTPYLHWWFSTSALDTVYLLFFIFFLLIKLFQNNKIAFKSIISIAIIYLSTSFLLILYPPFQIPGLWLLIFCVSGYLLNCFGLKGLIKKIKTNIFFLFLISFSLILFIFLFYIDLKEVIYLMMNTSYPGTRIIEGGGYNFIKFNNFFYNFILIKGSHPVPDEFLNQSEASNFAMLYIFLLPLLIHKFIKNFITKHKFDYFELLLSLYLIISTIWLFIGLPMLIERISLLYMVPIHRISLFIGLGGYILCFYYIFKDKTILKTDRYITYFVISLMAFFLFYYFGHVIKSRYPLFLNNTMIVLLIALISAITTFLLLIRNKLFIIILTIISFLTSLCINPIYISNFPTTSSKISDMVRNVENKDPNQKWIHFGSLLYGNLLISNGINSINSTHYYPQFAIWDKIDPDGSNLEIYNRYAHIEFIDNEKTEIQLIHADTIRVLINPCSQELLDLNIKYYFSELELNYECLKKVDEVKYTNLTFSVYEKI